MKQDDGLCTRSLVDLKVMSTECDIAVDSDRPVNFGVAANQHILFVGGAVAPSVARLALLTGASGGIDLQLVSTGGVDTRYFGYAVSTNSAKSVVGFNSAGNQIYEERGKIEGVRSN
ncbi:hypothetical protein ACWEIJ_13105 [Lentzea sp. NPDC004789]